MYVCMYVYKHYILILLELISYFRLLNNFVLKFFYHTHIYTIKGRTWYNYVILLNVKKQYALYIYIDC